MNNPTTVSVCLEAVKFAANHGVFEQEALVGNEFVVDMEVRYCTDLHSLKSDDLTNTISYADLYSVVKEQMGERRALLETVAAKILSCAQSKWPAIVYARVKIRKVRVPIAGIDGSASVELTLMPDEVA